MKINHKSLKRPLDQETDSNDTKSNVQTASITEPPRTLKISRKTSTTSSSKLFEYTTSTTPEITAITQKTADFSIAPQSPCFDEKITTTAPETTIMQPSIMDLSDSNEQTIEHTQKRHKIDLISDEADPMNPSEDEKLNLDTFISELSKNFTLITDYSIFLDSLFTRKLLFKTLESIHPEQVDYQSINEGILSIFPEYFGHTVFEDPINTNSYLFLQDAILDEAHLQDNLHDYLLGALVSVHYNFLELCFPKEGKEYPYSLLNQIQSCIVVFLLTLKYHLKYHSNYYNEPGKPHQNIHLLNLIKNVQLNDYLDSLVSNEFSKAMPKQYSQEPHYLQTVLFLLPLTYLFLLPEPDTITKLTAAYQSHKSTIISFIKSSPFTKSTRNFDNNYLEMLEFFLSLNPHEHLKNNPDFQKLITILSTQL